MHMDWVANFFQIIIWRKMAIPNFGAVIYGFIFFNYHCTDFNWMNDIIFYKSHTHPSLSCPKQYVLSGKQSSKNTFLKICLFLQTTP